MRKILVCCACLLGVMSGMCLAKWARVQNGEAKEVFAYRPDFHAEVMKYVIECPDNIEQKWRKIGASWLPPKSYQEIQNETFDQLRIRLLSLSGARARSLMVQQFRYRLTGPLVSGYPDPAQPLCTNAVGTVLTLEEFNAYIQDRDDEGASQPELNALKQQAKQVRQYLKSLKGD